MTTLPSGLTPQMENEGLDRDVHYGSLVVHDPIKETLLAKTK